MNLIRLIPFVIYSISLVTSPLTQANPLAKQPKLILQLTIDQFAGNQLSRFKNHLSPMGGFSYLLNHGIWYDNAHQYHATTQTAVGHTTLATGTPPKIHGIIANHWWDARRQREIYAVEDGNDVRSPRNILVESFSDALSKASNGKSKRFAVSTKDRGAIPLAGKKGKAFWFDRETGLYVSSPYYYKQLPQWVNRWNSKKHVNQYLSKSWTLSKPCKHYLFCNDGLEHLPSSVTDFKRQFPHPLGNKPIPRYYHLLTISPVSDSLTLLFSKALISNEKLGQREEIDFLAISLSATDAVGHTFGPYSVESEDNFIRLNEALGNFFRFVDQQVGLENVLIVLSADHGATPSATYLSQFNIESGEFSLHEVINHPPVKTLLTKLKLDWSKLVVDESPNLYLNNHYLKSKGIDKEAFTHQLSRAISTYPKIAYAIKTTSLAKQPGVIPTVRKLLANQFSTRSGDIYLIPKPFFVIDDSPNSKAHHGSPWRYDTHVPIIFSHPKLTQRRVSREVHTIDIVPTLAAIFNLSAPAQARGQVLSEIKDQLSPP